MRWLVTGGAGYIGAHVVKALRESGEFVVVLDLPGCSVERVNPTPVVMGSVLDRDLLVETLRRHRIDVVIHIAARKQVGESVIDPLPYYRENVGGLESLVDAMVKADVQDVVFSSSAAVYGTPSTPSVSEDSPLNPINPYGHTKVIGEKLLEAAAQAYGVRYTSLRYFNVAGAGDPRLGDPNALNLIPIVFHALKEHRRPSVFGEDYETPDGTCIRDYVHVEDIANAHLVVAAALHSGAASQAFNVGVGRGFSVLEVMRAIQAVTGLAIDPISAPRRAGDPAALVADVDKAAEVLGWSASKATLEEIIESSWMAFDGKSDQA